MTESNFRALSLGDGDETEDPFDFLDKTKIGEALHDLIEALKKKSGVDAVRATARGIDAVGPVMWSKKAWDWYYEKMQARAKLDPAWNAIQDRRKNDHGTITFLSDDLTLADWDTQSKIERELTPEPKWVKTVRAMDRFSASGFVGRAISGVQRAKRGWSESDVWGMDHHLARITAEMLDHLANTTHGWPGGDEFPTFEGWQEIVHEKAADLNAWVKGEDHGEETSAWYALKCDPAADPAVVEAAWDAMREHDEARYEAAKAAMVWVGEHLGGLWD